MTRLFAFALAFLCSAAHADDYFGVLRPPVADFTPGVFSSFESSPSPLFSATLGDARRLRLGYRYTPHLSVEGEFSDYARWREPFTNPASLSSAFRGTLIDPAPRATRWRYGLGMRYDFTPSLGIRAEVERRSVNPSAPMAGEIDADQVSLGLSWRF